MLDLTEVGNRKQRSFFIFVEEPYELAGLVYTTLCPCNSRGICISVGTVTDLSSHSTDNFPDRLQCLRQPIIDDRICKNAYSNLFTENMVCSGFMAGGASSCQVSPESSP